MLNTANTFFQPPPDDSLFTGLSGADKEYGGKKVRVGNN
jgi:hypothetical protein